MKNNLLLQDVNQGQRDCIFKSVIHKKQLFNFYNFLFQVLVTKAINNDS